MRRRALVLALTLTNAALADAQASHMHAFRVGFHFHIGAASQLAALCDGSAVRGVESRKTTGKVLGYGGAILAAGAGFAVAEGSVGALPLVTAGIVGGGVGYYMMSHASLSTEFWNDVLTKAKVGETRADDVSACLGAPNGVSTSANQLTWTYASANIGGTPFGLGGSSTRAVSFVFSNGVLTNVRRDENAFGR